MIGFSQHHYHYGLPKLLVAAIALFFSQNQEVLAWIPVPLASMECPADSSSSSSLLLKMSSSADVSYSVEKQSLLVESRAPTVVGTSTTTTDISISNSTMLMTAATTTATCVNPVDDYTEIFTSCLEERRRELEEVNNDVNVASLEQQPLRTTYSDNKMPTPTKPAKKKEGQQQQLEQALAMTASGIKIAFEAIRFIVNETVQAAQSWDDVATTTFDQKKKKTIVTDISRRSGGGDGDSDSREAESITTYGEAFAKIAKSGRGLLKLVEVVKDSLLLVASRGVAGDMSASSEARFRGTHSVPERSGGVSATLAIVNGKDTIPSQVTYRPTISLSPAKASALWGYTVEREPTFSSLEQRFKDMTSNAGQWAEHVLAVAGQTIQNKILESAVKVEVEVEDTQKRAATTATTATGPGPAYFLNVQDNRKEEQRSLPVSYHHRHHYRRHHDGMFNQDKVFFFAN